MYLSELKLWNFRKYGIKGDKIETAKPGLQVEFEKGVNVLVGENDSGKTAIIDAIRYVLKTQSQEFIQLDDKDFYKEKEGHRTEELKIECTFSGFDDTDAGHFLEWIGFDGEGDYKLKIWLYAKRKDNHIYPTVRAGVDTDGSYMEGEARDLLRVIYLKPLRDALIEMTNGRKSRLAQILKNLDAFKRKNNESGDAQPHKLETYYKNYKEDIDKHFVNDPDGSQIKNSINEFLLKGFLFKEESRSANLTIEDNELNEILRDLNLILEDNKSGLGSLNLLCMAAELLHLKEQKVGLKLTLIEELEAHLHPQYQLRVIDFIENNKKKYGQFILTTHSTTLASKIDLKKLIICQKNNVFPMEHKHTQLEEGDYQFLQRFLDATKSNLFFARGVIIVEGDAENLLIPTIAEIIGRSLHEYGVSIVNVGSTAFKRYAKIFLRKGKDDEEFKKEWLDIPVSIISDLDIRSIEYYKEKKSEAESKKDSNYKEKKVWLIQNSDIANLVGITKEVDWENVVNRSCNSKSELEEIIKENKSVPKYTGKGIQKKLDEAVNGFSEDITEEFISELRSNKKGSAEKQLNVQNNKIFLADKWTLEYDIACSGLAPYLEKANDMAKALKRNENKVYSSGDVNKIISEIDVNYKVDIQKAYDLFKPLNDGEISKAVTAQCLATLLEEDKAVVKGLIIKDSYLKYICDAIYHVTVPAKKGGKND